MHARHDADAGPGPSGANTALEAQRVEAPTLHDQLAAYEARQQALQEALEEFDAPDARWVYLVLSALVGVVAAVVVASAIAVLWLWLL